MICKDNMPFSCVEKQGMIKLLRTAAPLYKPPTRKTITSLVEKKYLSLRSIVNEKLKSVSNICITTDIATVRNSTRSFLVLTAHYIDEEDPICQQESISLGVHVLTPHHTAQNICEDLTAMLREWAIKKENIIAITTDNGANIVAGVKLLSSNSRHVSCFAHNINLVVLKSLGSNPEVVTIIEKVKNIVSYFKHSNVAMDDLREEQKKEGKTDGTFVYLIQEVPTRWNSTFYCLQRFFGLAGHVGKILLQNKHKNSPMFTAFEIFVIEECLTLLQPLVEATKDISGDKYVSGSLVIPLTNLLTKSIVRINASTNLAKNLKYELLEQIEKRLNPCEKHPLLSAATILDPRFKKLHFNSCLNVANTISLIKEKIRMELRGSNNSPSSGVRDIEESINSDTQGTCKNKIWQLHMEIEAKDLTMSSEKQSSESLPTGLKLYLCQPIQPWESHPIDYWTANKNAFPATYKAALKYLTVVGLSYLPKEWYRR